MIHVFPFILCVFFFFFKQKTAYEMRISDWSSDVCSSDLGLELGATRLLGELGRADARNRGLAAESVSHQEPSLSSRVTCPVTWAPSDTLPTTSSTTRLPSTLDTDPLNVNSSSGYAGAPSRIEMDLRSTRSEEHTSELQSTMRISYDVLCLNKKT